ncbi:GAF domain-containing protein [Calditrichota bacterium LG25]
MVEFNALISERLKGYKELKKKIADLKEIGVKTFSEINQIFKEDKTKPLVIATDIKEIKRLAKHDHFQALNAYYYLFVVFYDPSENLSDFIVRHSGNCEFYAFSLLERLPEILSAKIKHSKKIRERVDQDRFKLIVQNMPVMVDAFDNNNNFIFWNKECEKVTGYSASEMINNPKALEILYPDASYRETLLREYARRGNHFRNWEVKLTTKDGREKIIAWSNLSDIYKVPGWSSWAVGIDITLRHNIEKRLEETEFLLNSLLAVDEILQKRQTEEQICDQILHKIKKILPFKGSIIVFYDFERQTAEIVAVKLKNQILYRSEKVIPLKSLINLEQVKSGKVVYFDDISIYKEKLFIINTILKLGLKSGFIVPLVFENRVVGSMSFLFEEPVVLEENREKLLKIIGKKLAFTLKQKRIVQELQEKIISLGNDRLYQMSELKKNEARLRAQFESLPLPTLIWQKQGEEFVLIDYNDMALASSFGRINEFLGKSSSAIYHFIPQLTEMLEECYSNEISLETQLEINIPGNQTGYLSIKLAYVAPDSIIMHIEDITEQKDIELRLKRSAEVIRGQLKTIELYKEEISILRDHLLPIINGYCRSLWEKKELIENDSFFSYFSQIHKNLLNSLYFFNEYFATEVERVDRQEVQIDDLIRKITQQLQPAISENKVQVLTHIENNVIHTDENLLLKTLEILVKLSINHKHQDRNHLIRITSVSDNNRSVIIFKDNSQGFSERDMNLIRKDVNFPANLENTTYLDVLILKKLAKIMDADISIESIPEEGCQFSIIFRE